MVDPTEQLDEHGARLEHVDSFTSRPSHRTLFDRLLCEVLGYKPTDGRDGRRDGRRQAMRSALGNKATLHQIRDWRRGKSPAPKWAVEMLAEQAAQKRFFWTVIDGLFKDYKTTRN